MVCLEPVSEPSDQTDVNNESQNTSVKDSPDGNTASPDRLKISWTGDGEADDELTLEEEAQDASVDDCLVASYGGEYLGTSNIVLNLFKELITLAFLHVAVTVLL